MRKKADFGLYLVTDRGVCLGRPLERVVAAAVRGGVSLVQVREKSCPTRDYIETVDTIQKILKPCGVPLIINDRVDIAVILEADGAHVGKGDMPLFLSRQLLRDGKILGCSATNLKEALQAEQGGADYLGVGPIFSTPSKQDAAPPIGLKELEEICHKVTIPVVAIGGISLKNIEKAIKAGAAGVAVISAVANAKDMKKATEELVDKIKKTKGSGI